MQTAAPKRWSGPPRPNQGIPGYGRADAEVALDVQVRAKAHEAGEFPACRLASRLPSGMICAGAGQASYVTLL